MARSSRAPHTGKEGGWPHWTTPVEVVDRLASMGGAELDPCSNPASIVGALVALDGSPGRNGLLWSWVGRGLVYVNPPFGREVGEWAAKAAREGRLGAEVVWLAPARTDTEWFHGHVLRCRALVLVRGRLAFGNPDPDAPPTTEGGSLAHGLAIAYWGARLQVFRQAFADMGLFVVPRCSSCEGRR